jgi:arylsulfatase
VVNGIPQTPIEGVSMQYTFGNATAEDRHRTQYFEMYCNRAIYNDGWLAGTVHGAPWETGKPRAALENDKWELYDTRADFSLADDLAGKYPEKLKEMQELFMKEAVKYNVLPLDDRKLERLNAALVDRPDLMAGRTSLTVYEGMTGISENVFINIKNRSHAITAEVIIPKGGAKGVILAQAGRFGGWSLYLKDGKPTYTYNFLGLKRFTISAKNSVPAGKATVRYEFAYDGGGLGKGGLGRIIVNGKKVAEGRIEHTQPMAFSIEEGASVGEDGETPVVENYGIPAPYKFTGKINKVTIDLKEMKKAEKVEEDKLRTEATHRMAILDQ